MSKWHQKTMINWFSRCTDSWIQTDVEVDGGRMQHKRWQKCRHFVHLHLPKHLSSGYSTIGTSSLRRIHEASAHVTSYMHWPKSTAGEKLRRWKNWNVFALRSIFPIRFYAFSHCAFSNWLSPRCALHIHVRVGICIRIPHTDLLISDIVFVIAVCWQSHTNRCVLQ